MSAFPTHGMVFHAPLQRGHTPSRGVCGPGQRVSQDAIRVSLPALPPVHYMQRPQAVDHEGYARAVVTSRMVPPVTSAPRRGDWMYYPQVTPLEVTPTPIAAQPSSLKVAENEPEATKPHRQVCAKSSLTYILSNNDDSADELWTSQQRYEASSADRTPSSDCFQLSDTTVSQDAAQLTTKTATKKKRRARICTAENCSKYVVDHGLCIRHGGGKRCYIDNCNCRAQNRGLCWKHGGFTICKVDNCTKRAKSRGICWSHGGGTRCKRDYCTKIAVSMGLCWAHGGGKRCAVARCRKPASERTNNMCSEHCAGAMTYAAAT